MIIKLRMVTTCLVQRSMAENVNLIMSRNLLHFIAQVNYLYRIFFLFLEQIQRKTDLSIQSSIFLKYRLEQIAFCGIFNCFSGIDEN